MKYLNKFEDSKIHVIHKFSLSPVQIPEVGTRNEQWERDVIDDREMRRYLENGGGSDSEFNSFHTGSFHTRVSTSWTPPLSRNYHYLKIIFPSKSRVLTEYGHRQHHELGEYETTHSLYYLSFNKFPLLFNSSFCLIYRF